MPGTTGKKTEATAKQAPKKAQPKAASKTGYGLGLTSKSFDLELPSGHVCRAVRPGAQGLIKAGLLDSMDQLTSLVQTEHIDSKDPRKLAKAVEALSVNKQQLLEGLEMVDRCVVYVVQEPKVYTEPPAGEERDPERIYADEVDLEDKMFIFNWAVGGTSDLKSFREESQQLLGSLSAG